MRIIKMHLFPFLLFGAIPPPHGHHHQIGAQMFDPYFGLYDGGMGLYGAYNPFLYSPSLSFGHANPLAAGFGGYGANNGALFNPFQQPFGQSALMEFPMMGGGGNNGLLGQTQPMNPFAGGLLSALGIGNGNNNNGGGGPNILQLPQNPPFQISNNNVGNSAPFGGRQIRSRYGSGGLLRGGSAERMQSQSIFTPSIGGQGGTGCTGGGGLFSFGRDCGGDTKKD